MSKKQTITYPISELLQRILLRVSPNSLVRSGLEIIFLFALGLLATLLHQKLRIPLQMPGRQGMVFMALLLFGRLSSNLTLAGFFTTLGSSAMLLGGGFSTGDPFTPMIYPLLGLTLDLLYRLISDKGKGLFLLSLIAGLSWMMIPVCRLLINIFTYLPLHSFRYGPVVPLLTHFVFGMLGGILGFSVSHISRRKTSGL